MVMQLMNPVLEFLAFMDQVVGKNPVSPIHAVKHLVISVNGTLLHVALLGNNPAPFNRQSEAVGACDNMQWS